MNCEVAREHCTCNLQEIYIFLFPCSNADERLITIDNNWNKQKFFLIIYITYVSVVKVLNTLSEYTLEFKYNYYIGIFCC